MESRRGIHVIHVLVIDERAGLANQRVDHVAKVDGFLAVAELPRHAFDALVLVPKFQMVLVNAHLQSQADVLAAYRVDVSLHANDAIGLHCQGQLKCMCCVVAEVGGQAPRVPQRNRFSRDALRRWTNWRTNAM